MIEFATIASALQVSGEEIEAWAIDVIRAGLVEAKLDEGTFCQLSYDMQRFVVAICVLCRVHIYI